MAIKDVAVVADGGENAALPLLIETQLGCGDRHCASAARVPSCFRSLPANQRVHCPPDDRGPLRIVGSGRSHHREGHQRLRENAA